MDHNRPMQSKPHSIWWPRIATFLLWAAAAAGLAFWGLKWTGAGARLPLVAALGSAGAVQSDPQVLVRLLGAGSAVAPVAAAPGLASRFALLGVVAGPHGAGVALISVDGKPARPYEVGARVDGPLLLKSVASRQATLAGGLDAPAAVTLDLPPMKRLPAPAGTPPLPMIKPNPFEGNPFKPSITPN